MVRDQTILEGSVCAALFLHYTSGDWGESIPRAHGGNPRRICTSHCLLV